ncbi:unnamed protein product [Rhizoctonia solani]|uniref:Uncharacterized protein n=1 Tax=Rhizoctonia solani TaxID=456999 RepID=A0A8H3A1V8_9AGAM|nr:unnamed protein product [Rhizoctonia solani]
MTYDNDTPTARGRLGHSTPGGSIPHPKKGDKVGYRMGNDNPWSPYKVTEVNRDPEPGCRSGGLYTLEAQTPFKVNEIITTTRDHIQFPFRGQE